MLLGYSLNYSLKSFCSLRRLLRLGEEETGQVGLVSNPLNTVYCHVIITPILLLGASPDAEGL